MNNITALPSYEEYERMERPYVCEQCGQRFKDTRYLRRHLKSGTCCTLLFPDSKIKAEPNEYESTAAAIEYVEPGQTEEYDESRVDIKILPFLDQEFEVEEPEIMDGSEGQLVSSFDGIFPDMAPSMPANLPNPPRTDKTATILYQAEENRCPFCDKCYLYQPDLKVHVVRTHSHIATTSYIQSISGYGPDYKPFGCTLCGKKFTSKYRLKRHEGSNACQSDVTPPSIFTSPDVAKPHTCEHCSKRFTLKNHKRRHILFHCPVIKQARLQPSNPEDGNNAKTLGSSNNLSRSDSSRNNLCVPSSSKKEPGAEELDTVALASYVSQNFGFELIKLKPEESVTFVDIPSSPVAEVEDVEVKATHSAKISPLEINRTCTICSKTCKTLDDLRHHLIKSHSDHPIVSLDPEFDKMSKAYDALKKLGRHRGAAKNVPMKLYGCDNCGRRFTSSPHLIRHQRTVCYSTGTSARKQKLPTMTDIINRPHFCDRCGNRFTRKSHLTRHWRNTVYCRRTGTAALTDPHESSHDNSQDTEILIADQSYEYLLGNNMEIGLDPPINYGSDSERPMIFNALGDSDDESSEEFA